MMIVSISTAAIWDDSLYENCTGIVTTVANAVCDIDNNIKSCKYDGGDCCPSTCVSTEDVDCTTDTRECINPEAEDYPYAEFESCAGLWRYINDSVCDNENNNADCDYDGGDCCPSTCNPSTYCPQDNSPCINPTAEDFGYKNYMNCTGYMPYAGNGRCNEANNNVDCGYDGGDCCQCTCIPDEFNCVGEFNCVDPDFVDIDDECGRVKSCPVNTPQQWVVQDTAGATELAQNIKCSGGVFNVEWKDHVVVTETIWVTDQTTLNITGSGGVRSAIADGNGTIRILAAINATLHLENMQLTHGSAASAGALFVGSNANATFSGDMLFTNNTATVYSGGAFRVANGGNISSDGNLTITNNMAAWHGAAIHVDASFMSLHGSVTFVGNIVDTGRISGGTSFGGAIFASKQSEVYWSGHTTFLENRFIGDFVNRRVFCYGGAIAAVSGSTVSWTGRTSFIGNEACYGGGVLYANTTATYIWTAETIFSDNKAGISGGAVLLEGASDASWSGATLFEGGKAYNGGGVVIVEESTMKWTADTSFSGNVATSYGGAVYVSDSSALECRAATTFEKNTASEGGALYVRDGPTVTLNRPVNFTHNVAVFQGGAIYAVADTLTTAETSFLFNAPTFFFNNSAGTYGGALMVSGSMTFVLGSYSLDFERNRAGSTGGAVLFTGVGTAPTFYGSRFVRNEAQIGGAVYATGTGTVISATGESYPLTFDGCNFTGNEAASTGGAVESAAGNDYFVNTSFVGNVAKQGGALRLAGTASIVECRFERNLAAEGGGPAISDVGYTEEMRSTYFVDNDFNCDPGFFLLYEKGERYPVVCLGCIDCEGCIVNDNSSHPTCEEAYEHTRSTGGDVVLETLNISKGYWRATTTSSEILECFNRDACLGGITGSTDFCATGYEGSYCAVCSRGYAESLSYTCRICSDDKATLVAWFVVPSAIVLGLVFLGYMTSKEWGTGNRGFSRSLKMVPVQSIKIVIVAWQILTALTSVANISFPTAYEIFLEGAELLNFEVGWILSAGCFVDMDFHGRLITSTVGPIAAMGVLGFTYKFALYRNRELDEAISKVRGKHVSMALWITFLVYSSASSAVFQMFSCENLDDGKSYLRADYTILCSSSKHQRLQVYAAFMILVYPVGIPLVYSALLFVGRDAFKISPNQDTSEPRVKAALQLSSPYRPGCFYYEVVECARRVTLTGGIVFVLPNEMGQVAVTLVLTVMFALLSEFLAPYRSTWDSWISRIGHVVIFLSVFVAFLAFYIDDGNGNSGRSGVYGNALVGANICWVVAAVAESVTTACSGTTMGKHLPRSVSSAVVGFCDDGFCDGIVDSIATHHVQTFGDDGYEGDLKQSVERPRFRPAKTFPMPAPRHAAPRDTSPVVL